MPYCDISGNGTKIFYRKYGHGDTKILLIIGLAGTHDSWGPQIKGLTGSLVPNDDDDSPETVAGDSGSGVADEDRREEDAVQVCCFDNRGMGKSSIPTKKSEYTTTIMAKDALALMDHLGWEKAHVFGHSMGGMIAYKLAAIAPDRICSLALLNVTGGGFECFPKFDRQMISLAIRFLRAKTPEQRALVDLETHYTKEYLDEYVGSTTRRSILYQEYVKGISSSGMQSSYGFEGQINACWTHKMTAKELEKISSSGFLISVIHGTYDIIAQVDHARSLAKKLRPSARMVELHGGHLVSHERPDEVNMALMDIVKATKSNTKPAEWSYLDEKQSAGWLALRMPLSIINSDGANSILTTYNLLGKLQFSFLYFIGVIMMGYEHMRNVLNKPVRVGISSS